MVKLHQNYSKQLEHLDERKKFVKVCLVVCFFLSNKFVKLINLAEAAQGIVQEGKQAIDGNEQHPVFDTSPESFVLGKNE